MSLAMRSLLKRSNDNAHVLQLRPSFYLRMGGRFSNSLIPNHDVQHVMRRGVKPGTMGEDLEA